MKSLHGLLAEVIKTKKRSEDQEKAYKALVGAATHAKRIDNPDWAWIAAGACDLKGSSFEALVREGVAVKRPVRGDASRRWDYRLKPETNE